MSPAKLPSVRSLPALEGCLGKGLSVSKDTITPLQGATPPTNRAVRRAQPLGNPTQFASGQVAAGRWSLQATAASLLPKSRMASCMRAFQRGLDAVQVQYVAKTQSSHYAGLMACASCWTCPVCAAKITERRRIELQATIKRARAQHLRVVMITYTFSHHAGDNLDAMLAAMRGAFKRYKSGRSAARLRMAYGVVGTVRALEVTHSTGNGWHPHIHELVFLPEEVDVQAYGAACRSAWFAAAGAYGLTMNEHGFRLDTCDNNIAAYVAKWGHDPNEATKQKIAQGTGWDEAAELTKWHVKKGRTAARGDDDHVSPFGLLRYYAAGDLQAGDLFKDYAKAFKKQKQLHWSQGLRALLQLEEEKSDEEVIAEQEEEAVTLAAIGHSGWQVVLGNDARYEVLDVARSGDPEQLAAFLIALGLYLDGGGVYQDAAFMQRFAA